MSTITIAPIRTNGRYCAMSCMHLSIDARLQYAPHCCLFHEPLRSRKPQRDRATERHIGRAGACQVAGWGVRRGQSVQCKGDYDLF
jgi:hypothetical protein